MARSIRCPDPAAALLGEGPVWVAREQALYWTDIHGRLLHRHEPASGANRQWPTPFRIGCLAPRSQGGFVAGSDEGFVLIDETVTRFEVIARPEPDLPGNRFNDGKLDPAGRFWAGTMDDAQKQRTGSLYRLDPDLRWSCRDSGYAITNGPAFSPSGATMYHTDSAARTIFRFSVDPGGDVHDKSVFAQFEPNQGHPDGMTTDREGCVWVAFWDGWCLRRLNPLGEIMEEVQLPVQRPTSCAFGGAEMKTLFVTSARMGVDAAAQPLAGGLLAFEPGMEGIPSPEFRS